MAGGRMRLASRGTLNPSDLKPKAVAKVATQALKLAQKARSEQKKSIETKYFDRLVSDGEVISYGGDVTLLTNISQGDDISQRQGNRVSAKYLALKGYMIHNDAHQTNNMRVIVFCDTQNQGTDPTPGDVLSIVGDNSAVTAFINIDHTPRYKILYDKKLSTSVTGEQVRHFSKVIKLKGKQIHFTGTDGTPYKNALYSLCIADVNTDDPQVTLNTRFAYTDA